MKAAFLLLLLAAALPAQPFPLWLDLSGDWRISATDEPRFASPAVDDSAWERFPMPARRLPPVGTYWLRTRFTLPAGADTKNLALTLGSFIEVYEVFLNGQRIGARGEQRISQRFVSRPKTFPVPPGLLQPGESVTIALRLWRPQFSSPRFRSTLGVPDRGPYLLTNHVNTPPFVSEAGMRERERLAASSAFLAEFYGLMLGLILLAWITDRQRTELVWLGLILLAGLLRHGGRYCWFVADNSHVDGVLFGPLGGLYTASFVALAFSLAGWKHRWAPLLAVAPFLVHVTYNTVVYVGDTGFGNTPFQWMMWITYSFSQATGWFFAVRTIARRDLPVATRLLCGVVAVALALELQVAPSGAARPLRFTLSGAGFEIGSSDLLTVLLTLLLTALVLARFLADRREKVRLAGELEAARTVQQLLLPTATPANLDAIYIPAAEVGGDFWYVFDNNLIVTGDVSGKGLKAAMVVALIVGVLRETNERAPARVLETLNRALTRSDSQGFVTCCCVHIDRDGNVTIANAGHPAPWMNGVEAAVLPGLPLGLDPEATYSEATSQIPVHGQLTLVSDGVIEAANAKGELFGFDRTAALSTKPAAEIAEAARAWGQTDDITVLTLQRSSAA